MKFESFEYPNIIEHKKGTTEKEAKEFSKLVARVEEGLTSKNGKYDKFLTENDDYLWKEIYQPKADAEAKLLLNHANRGGKVVFGKGPDAEEIPAGRGLIPSTALKKMLENKLKMFQGEAISHKYAGEVVGEMIEEVVAPMRPKESKKEDAKTTPNIGEAMPNINKNMAHALLGIEAVKRRIDIRNYPRVAWTDPAFGKKIERPIETNLAIEDVRWHQRLQHTIGHFNPEEYWSDGKGKAVVDGFWKSYTRIFGDKETAAKHRSGAMSELAVNRLIMNTLDGNTWLPRAMEDAEDKIDLIFSIPEFPDLLVAAQIKSRSIEAGDIDIKNLVTLTRMPGETMASDPRLDADGNDFLAGVKGLEARILSGGTSDVRGVAGIRIELPSKIKIGDKKLDVVDQNIGAVPHAKFAKILGDAIKKALEESLETA